MLDRLLGNFEVSGIFQAQSGHPFSVFGGVDSAGSGLSQRADFVVNGNGLAATPCLNQRTHRAGEKSVCQSDAASRCGR